MSWWRRRSETVRDAVGAVLVVVVFVVAEQIFGDGGSIVRAAVTVAVMASALTVRRRWPLVTFVAAVVTVAMATTGLVFLAIASYTLVAHRPRTRPGVVAGASAVAMLIGFLRYWPTLVLAEVAGDLFLIAAVAVLPAVFGRMVRVSRRKTAELRSRNAELMTLREKEARHAVEAERFRIARELHDVVAHHASAMTVRARAGRHVAADDPQAAEEALAYIAEAGTETLTAMGAFVGTLRGQQTETDSGALAPQPTVDDLPDLLESFRGAGLVVHDELDLPGTPVGSSLGLNVYRIVQEALTNAIRHGAAERAWVEVWFADDKVHIQIDDNGRGLPTDRPAAGHGLVGIAERAGLHGGISRLGASPRGGCRLEATLEAGRSSSTEHRPPAHEPVEAPAVSP